MTPAHVLELGTVSYAPLYAALAVLLGPLPLLLAKPKALS